MRADERIQKAFRILNREEAKLLQIEAPTHRQIRASLKLVREVLREPSRSRPEREPTALFHVPDRAADL